MGKRGAAKPKAAGPASSAKRAKTTGPPPPAAPSSWGRPQPPGDVEASALRFFLVDIEDGPSGTDGLEVRLYGVTAEGVSVCARVHGLRPYFYVRCSPDTHGREEDLRAALEAALPAPLIETTAAAAAAAGGLPGNAKGVLKVEKVRRTPVFVFQPEDDFLRITVVGQKLMLPSVKALEKGIAVPAADGKAAFDFQSSATFEANVSHILRFLVDHELGGGRWVEVLPGSFKLSPAPRLTAAQLEVDVQVQLGGDEALRAVPLQTELGSSIPPLRTLALEVLVNSDSEVSAAACTLSVQGEKQPRARAIWLLRAPGTPTAQAGSSASEEWSAVTVEVYNPDEPEPPKVFVSENEQALLDHIGETLALLDADILLTYDLARTCRGVLGKKGVAKAGSPLVRGLCRRLAAELKITAKSNEVSGLAGRLGFDLQKQVEKDHRLTDYSLGNLLEHFCQLPLPELNEATLARLAVERPRALAQHVLRQAEASFQIFEHLAYLFNFVEMARVTGVPLAWLLERGQAVKVQAQLLQEARRQAYILPSQRPGTGEENTFEGATVLEPASGFYRCPVAVLDFASLYPSIMMAHNICYSTLLPAGREKSADAPAHAAAPPTAVDTNNDQRVCFVNPTVRRGLLPTILERLLAARKSSKKELAACPPQDETRRKILNGRQLALKLSANSVYGFTGALNGPMPCLEVAGAVTAYGREMIQATKRLVERQFTQGNGYACDAEVLYGDTDSVMVRFGSDDTSLEQTMQLSQEAARVCSDAFAAPVRLEFEKVYRPFLLMNKKRYAGLAWTSTDRAPEMETKGLETVRRDWSDLVRQGLEQTLKLLCRPDNSDGTPSAVAYVQGLVEELRQNKTDFRSLVISKSLGKEEYAAKTPHMELAEKLRKRDPSNAPRMGDRVSYLVLAGAKNAKVYEKVEDPLYALEHGLPIDADYYLENQLKQPLLRVFEHVCGTVQKAEQSLFTVAAGQKVVTTAAPSLGGMGKFLKPKPKCLACGTASAKGDGEAFCLACEKTAIPEQVQQIKQCHITRAQNLQAEMAELRAHCETWCSVPSGSFKELAADAASGTTQAQANAAKEVCFNTNCRVIFRRVRFAKDIQTSRDALARLKVTDW
mmetsp:Transcript_129778/g.236124  ORF Transcript_129778/g.236124 Transcript_129778/m.236124 type:complete len:1114 (+) Transcript_129778:72-3413(+)